MEMKEKIVVIQNEIQGLKQQLNLIEQSKMEILTLLVKKQGVLEYLEAENKNNSEIVSVGEKI